MNEGVLLHPPPGEYADARKSKRLAPGPVIYVMTPPPLMNDNRNPVNHTQEATYPNETCA